MSRGWGKFEAFSFSLEKVKDFFFLISFEYIYPLESIGKTELELKIQNLRDDGYKLEYMATYQVANIL